MTHPHRSLLLGLLLLAACAGAPSGTSGDNEPRAAAYVESARDNPPLLGAFLRRMPKGGDLHNHLSGAIYAESYIRWAATGAACVDKKALALAPPPCTAPDRIPAAQIYADNPLYARLVDALSMRDFVPGAESGHDHFFAAFDKFRAAEAYWEGDMLAEAVERAGEENTLYLELMASPGMVEARKIGAKIGWQDDLGALRERMLAAGMANVVAAARGELDRMEDIRQHILDCDSAKASPGCGVRQRWLAQVKRVAPKEQIFAQALLGFELAKADARVVGLNLAAPEDDVVTLRDYRRQMAIVGFLGKLYPEVRVALHAGELVPGLVPPRDLRFHIRGAVETAGARRVGHGVDILEEDDPWGLLKEMAERRVMVEINLTSNEQILGVSGARHPFETYRRFHVPLALSTDDAGVSRIDLTHEYLRAALAYRLTYGDLKTLSRNSLEYAFLPGDSLWRSTDPFLPQAACAGWLGNPEPAPACREVLSRSEKAALQWRLEAAFAEFEALPWVKR